MSKNIIAEIRQTLKNYAEPQKIEASKRYFKNGEEPFTYGISVVKVNEMAKEFYNKIKNLSKKEIFEICEELWKSKYFEEAIIACKFSESLHKKYESCDFVIFERWVKNYVNNWADCDTLCNHTVGTFIMSYPEYLKELKKWTRASNRWVKRASAVTLIIPARKGMFLNDVFEIAEILLLDKDDLVQKGYGWMLKEASRKHQEEVFDFVISKKSVMPRTALRYAIEKMPQELKAEAMKK